RGLLGGRGADELVAVDERGFAVAPPRHLSAEVLGEALRPDRLAALGVEAGEGAAGGQNVDLAAGHDGRAVRLGAVVRVGRIPHLVAARLLVCPGAVLPLGAAGAVTHAIDARDGGEPPAAALHAPDLRRAVLRPRLQEARFFRDAVAVRAAPLRPVGG